MLSFKPKQPPFGGRLGPPPTRTLLSKESRSGRCVSPLGAFFFLLYSAALVIGGVMIGQSNAARKLLGKQRGGLLAAARERPLPGGGVVVLSPAGSDAAHDHSAPAAEPQGEDEHAHHHEEGASLVADTSLLGSTVSDERVLAGLSSEPPAAPGETYPAPLPAGFYMPADLAAEQRTIGWPELTVRRPTDAELEGTAFVTMATGDESARHALALIQSMRDCGSRIPTFHVMLFRGGGGSHDCHDSTSRRARNRDNIGCESLDTNAEEVVSRVYLDAFLKLGVTVTLDNPIPNTPFIEGIPGGRSIAWGMALNKLKVFGLAQYRKILWVDSDVLVLHNIDHLMMSPDFTAAFTNDCCNRNADAKMSGGMWVFHPTAGRWVAIQDMLNKPIPGSQSDAWLFGDMQVVLHAYGLVEKPTSEYKEWPFSRDLKQGMVPGVRVLPVFTNMTDDILKQELLSGGRRGKELPPPGILAQHRETATAAAKAWEEGADMPAGTSWFMLDPRYDGLVGDCECQAERDLGAAFFSVHFTCLPVTPPLEKPGRYETEAEFLESVRTRGKGCMRFYYLKWYDAFTRALGARLPPPLYDGPPVRVHDPVADGICDQLRQEAYDKAVAEERKRNGQA